MKVIISVPGVDPYSAKHVRRIELNGKEDITLGRVTFTLTRDAVEDLVKIGQATGIDVYIKQEL